MISIAGPGCRAAPFEGFDNQLLSPLAPEPATAESRPAGRAGPQAALGALRKSGPPAGPSRPAAALEQLIGDYFDVPCEIEQLVGAWYPLSASEQTALGDELGALGGGAVAGGTPPGGPSAPCGGKKLLLRWARVSPRAYRPQRLRLQGLPGPQRQVLIVQRRAAPRLG